MDRKQFTPLEDWLAMPDRKPLILRGARQVGKSTLVRSFAEGCKRPLAEVDLERHADLASAFARNAPVYLRTSWNHCRASAPLAPTDCCFSMRFSPCPRPFPH